MWFCLLVSLRLFGFFGLQYMDWFKHLVWLFCFTFIGLSVLFSYVINNWNNKAHKHANPQQHTHSTPDNHVGLLYKVKHYTRIPYTIYIYTYMWNKNNDTDHKSHYLPIFRTQPIPHPRTSALTFSFSFFRTFIHPLKKTNANVNYSHNIFYIK